jgi:predicted deacetylase
MPRLTVLLSLHDVTPRHLPRLTRAEALFRELGVTHATYLIVPRYHRGWAIETDSRFIAWCREPRPFTVRWCLHGYHHEEIRRSDRFSVRNWFNRQFLTSGEGEFLGLREAEIKRSIDRGREAFRACLGMDPAGFVAPAWLFNRALIPVLRDRCFAWTEDHRRIYDLKQRDALDAPVITWAARTVVHRHGSAWLAPALLRRWLERPVIRMAVHPLDFDHPRVVDAIRRTIAATLHDRVLDEYERVLALNEHVTVSVTR